MLERLFIQNVGLIESCEVDFSQGLTVITGETGAGKSMLIDALSLSLGSRASSSVIRHGCEKASVEASFILGDNPDLRTLLDNAGIDLETDNELVLRRHITSEKSRAFINGTQVTQTQMKNVGDLLVDIHGQHDHQMILRAGHHVHMLDEFGRLSADCKLVKNSFGAWRRAQDLLDDALERVQNREEEEALLRSYLEELDAFAPEHGEDEKLDAERKQLMNSEKLVETLAHVQACLGGESDITGHIGQAESALAAVASMAPDETAEIYQRFVGLSHELADIITEIDRLGYAFEPNPGRLQEVDERLFALRDLARKHQCTPDMLPDHTEMLRDNLEKMANLQGDMSALKEDAIIKRESFVKRAVKLSASRQKASDILSNKVETALVSLEMPNTKFKAVLHEKPESLWGEFGAESVEFMVATNAGTPLAPLVKVASGGEASRLMLALKQVFYADMPETTLVFDEVDTGVGGRVADAMGAVLQELSTNHQVFSITHLPQVAAKGGTHMHIAKSTSGDVTRSSLTPLKDDARLNEIARMLSGRDITEEALAAAKKLLS